MIPQVLKRWVLRVCDMDPIVKDNLWYQRSYKVKVRKFKGVFKDYLTVWFGLEIKKILSYVQNNKYLESKAEFK